MDLITPIVMPLWALLVLSACVLLAVAVIGAEAWALGRWGCRNLAELADEACRHLAETMDRWLYRWQRRRRVR